MMIFKKAAIAITVLVLFGVNTVFAQDELSGNDKIWMTQPGDTTKNWEGQTFHLGNGYFGASCYGGIQKEIFTLGEKTFWTGGPGDNATNDFGVIPPKDKNAIDKIKEYTSIGDVRKTDSIMRENIISRSNELGGLSSIGNLYFMFDNHDGVAKNYKRTLDLKNSVVTIEYEINDVTYKREYFCSYPNRVLAIRLSSNKPNMLSVDVGMDLFHLKRDPKTIVTPNKGMLEVQGNIDDNNRPYRVKVKAVNEGGEVTAKNNLLSITNASSATLYYTVATNYKLEAPLYRGANPEKITTDIIKNASKQGFEKLRDIHIADYQELYGRTKLTLESKVPEKAQLPTNERLMFYIQRDYRDIGLKELAFNFGKYTLISASRPGSLSVGLQGSWNNRYMAPWNGTNQLGVNVPLTYTYGNALNLSECQVPLIEFTKNRAIVGEQLADIYYNSDGWASFIVTDIWGHAGILPNLELKFVSSSWLSLILWEQYAFDQDKEYLKTIYPILKGASEFFLDNLVAYKETDKLVFISSVSNEHMTHLGAAVPNYQDIALVSELFENTIKAAEILNQDLDFKAKLMDTRSRLMPYKIGRLGQFQEWVEDIDDPNCQHRHINQLLALMPCKQINPYKQPEFAEAIKVTMNYRGDADFLALHGINGNSMEFASTCSHEGLHYDAYTAQVWCRAIRLATWLRVFDADRADKIYNDIFRESTLENMIQYETKANYGGPNSNDETPFFLDGITMSAGYVTEMVLQSQYGELDLLPALPSAWETGSLQGIRARGGFTVDVEWADGELVKAKITADASGPCKIRYKGKVKEVYIEKDEPFLFSTL